MNHMDISNALIARSDQLNSIDLVGGPVVVAVVTVKQGNAEQPVNIVTDVFGEGRPFKPSKTVLRILASSWGTETTEWVGRRMEIYREPSVRWAGEEIGGIRIKSLSHIDKPMTFNLPTSKGKHAKSTVAVLPASASPAPKAESLPAEAIADWVASFADAADITALAGLWNEAKAANVATHPEILAAKDARKAELT